MHCVATSSRPAASFVESDCFVSDCLSGRITIRFDETTELLTKVRYARATVEIDLSSSLIQGTEIQFKGLNIPFLVAFPV